MHLNNKAMSQRAEGWQSFVHSFKKTMQLNQEEAHVTSTVFLWAEKHISCNYIWKLYEKVIVQQFSPGSSISYGLVLHDPSHIWNIPMQHNSRCVCVTSFYYNSVH